MLANQIHAKTTEDALPMARQDTNVDVSEDTPDLHVKVGH